MCCQAAVPDGSRPHVPSISSVSLTLHETQTLSVSTPPVLLCRGEFCTRWGPAGALHRTHGAFRSARMRPPTPIPSTDGATHSPASPFSAPVPFREAPAYSNRRRRPPSTLAAPRVLLRSNSDNNLNSSAPDWAVCSAASHRSLSPQLLQQAPGKADGAVRTIGSYVPGPRSRSPSLNRLGGAGDDGKWPQQPWHVG